MVTAVSPACKFMDSGAPKGLAASAMNPGLGSYLAAPLFEPKLLWRGQLCTGLVDCNAILRRAGNGIATMDEASLKTLRAMKVGTKSGPVTAATDAELLQRFCVTDKERLALLARSIGARELPVPAAELRLETRGTSTKEGHPGQYPKVYRMTHKTAGQFDQDSLARLHVNRRASDGMEVHEFMQVLHGVAEWFFLVDGDACLLSLPAEHQIYYHGNAEHGGYFHAGSRCVLLSQIVGPATWVMEYTGTKNEILEMIKVMRSE